MHKEIGLLTTNNTWTLTHLPPHHKAVGTKWVFKVKYKRDGFLDKFKARLVAKEFT